MAKLSNSMNQYLASVEHRNPANFWPMAYGCVRCQQYHYEGEPLYATHIGFQSKHGMARRDPQFAEGERTDQAKADLYATGGQE